MEAKPIKVLLPSECISIHSWKVKSGATVRKGETIAFGLLSIEQSKITDKSTQKYSTSNTNETAINENLLSNGKLISSNEKMLNQEDNLSLPMKDIRSTDDAKKVTPPIKQNTSKMSARTRMLARAKAKKQNDFKSSNIVQPSCMLKISSPIDGLIQIIQPAQPEKSIRGENEDIILATVGPCTHPTIIDGLCVVCGQSITDENTAQSAKESRSASYLNHSSRKSNNGHTTAIQTAKEKNVITEKITVSGGITLHVTQSEANSIGKADHNRLKKLRKLSLVLDLDHTLVHATADRRGGFESSTRKDVRTILLPVGIPMNGSHQNQPQSNMSQVKMQHYIKLRPHLKEFFTSLQDLYEISIYTAGTREYALEVANIMSRHIAGQDLEEEDIQKMKTELQNAGKDLIQSKMGVSDSVTTTHSEVLYNVDEPAKNVNKLKMDDKERPSAKKNGVVVSIIKTKTDKTLMKGVQLEEEEHNQPKTKTKGESNQSIINEKNEFASNLDTTEKQITNQSNVKRNSVSEEGDKIPKKKRRVSFTIVRQKHPHSTPLSNMKLHEDPQFQNYIQVLRTSVEKAEEMERKVMDIRHKLFGDRIVSRTDVSDLGRDVKSLKRVFPCGGAMAAIVDDREDVWANGRDTLSDSGEKRRKGEPPENLLLVKPYKWQRFSGYEDVNNAAGIDLSAQQMGKNVKDDIDANDVQLLWIKDILKRLHTKFYAVDEKVKSLSNLTVPLVLSKLRKEVFGNSAVNANMVFSGLVPLMEQSRMGNKNGPRRTVERYAEDLGANVQHDVTNSTTHVVAARDGTDKVLRGRVTTGCTIVSASWLMECYWSMTRRAEKEHIIKSLSKKSVSQVEIKKKILLEGSDESEESDEEDDWMEDF